MIHQASPRAAKILRLLIFCFVSTLAVGAYGSAFGPDIDYDSPVPLRIRKQVSDDLEFLNRLEGPGASSYYREIFGGGFLKGKDLVEFIKHRIRLIALSECGGDGSVIACVQPNIDPTVMWLTKNYLTLNIPQIMRASLMLHESRHTEVKQDSWPHQTCPTPFVDESGNDIVGILTGDKLAGRRACDLSAYGSYGLQAVFLKNVELNCAACSEKVRMDAQLFGDDVLKRIIDPAVARRLKDDLK